MFALALLVITKMSVFNETSVLNAMEKADYFEKTADDLNEIIVNNTRPSGFPLSLFDDYLSEDDIHDLMVTYVKDGFNNNFHEIDINDFETKFRNDIELYLTNQNIVLNDTDKLAVDTYIQQNLEVYKHYTEFPFVEFIGKFINKFNKLFYILLIALLAIILFVALMIRKLHASIRRTKKYFAYSFIGGGLMLSVFSLFLYGMKIFEKINLSPKHLYDTIVYIAKTYLGTNIVVGLMLMAIGIVIAVVKKKNIVGKDYTHTILDHSLQSDNDDE